MLVQSVSLQLTDTRESEIRNNGEFTDDTDFCNIKCEDCGASPFRAHTPSAGRCQMGPALSLAAGQESLQSPYQWLDFPEDQWQISC